MNVVVRMILWSYLYESYYESLTPKGEYSKLQIEHRGEKFIIAYKGMSKVMPEKSYYCGNAPLDNYSQLFYVTMGLKSECTFFFSIT